ncbi:MAG: hypothetical protein CMI13_10020 [Oleibacter sp.]|nr:hypothetical protein [Thalassolituus sp.]
MIINALVFQVCWLACVIGGTPFALVAVSAFFIWHKGHLKPREMWLLAAVTLFGCLWDTLLLQLGFISLPPAARFYTAQIIPVWLLLLWLAFAMTLWHSLRWCSTRPWLAAVCGAVVAPLSYLAGERLGALQLSAQAPFWIAAGWTVMMTTVALITRRQGTALYGSDGKDSRDNTGIAARGEWNE